MNQMPMRVTFRTPNGVQLVADRTGSPSAPCVILLHGGGQTRHSWSSAVARLSNAGFQVINFDARGHGDSDWSADGRYSLADRAGDLASVVADLSVPYLLVGASLGGATAIHAIHDGLRPAGLVLVDIVPEPEPKGIDRIVKFMKRHEEGFATLDEAASAVAGYNPDRARPRDPQGLMKNLRAGADGRLYWHWDPKILAQPPETHHRDLAVAVRALGRLPDLPVMLIRGRSSDVVGESGVEALRAQLPWLQIRDVAGAGHMVAGDRNDAFVSHVLAFASALFAGDMVTLS